MAGLSVRASSGGNGDGGGGEMSDGCPKCAEKMARIKKLESALRELVRVNETSAGDDVGEWASAMLAAHEVLRDSEDEE